MRKLLIAIILMLSIRGVVYGVESADKVEYVRKDIYDVQMKAMNEKLDMILQKLDKQETAINEISGNLSHLSGRVDGLDARVGDLRNDIYLWLVILGIVIAVPYVQKTLQSHAESRKPSLTIEDVKRLIEEARIAGK